MTPYELNTYAEIYFKKKVQKEKSDITLAYLNSRWTIQWLGKKSEHPKPLNKILDDMYKEKKVMTAEDMLKRVEALNKMFGGEEIIVNS